ncbi:helix-turn-helix transcriptional regulator [Sporotomaculum syntrophicum]|nr:LuxR C-terminal-related transcriptional regulator [Sporotomaculum syntrophicum]
MVFLLKHATRGGEMTNDNINIDERKLSIIVHALFSSWMLSFLFEGQILYALADTFDLTTDVIIFGGIVALFSGLLLCGFFIKTKWAAKQLFLCSYLYFLTVSVVFFFPPSIFWTLGIITSAFLAGGCVAAWSFYFKSGTPKNERIKTAADVLICSNVLMILLNMAAIHLTPRIGLALSMLMLMAAFFFAMRLPTGDNDASPASSGRKESAESITGPLVFLCLFIVVITINSGLMYQVINPSFAHLQWLTSWYWAIPYIVALFIMRNLPPKTNHTYILYVALAMIGFSFIAFVTLDHSALSYLVVDTLILGACGIYDLFWWSILGEMLDLHKNPAKLFGIGMSANVLGVLLGGLIGSAIYTEGTHIYNVTLLALAVVCVTLALLPLLHSQLFSLLKEHAYLTVVSGMVLEEQSKITDRFVQFANLSERESQVTALLLQKKTYKSIAAELFISENTVKYYVKNIYAKFNVRSRAELIDIILTTGEDNADKK